MMTRQSGERTKSISIRGEDIKYKVVGQGPPLILLHGLSGSSHWWKRNLSALAAAHQVYLVDLPGYGMMRKRGKNFLLTDGAKWVNDFVDALNFQKPSVIGHSMGGYIALTFAASYPEKIKKLVLVAPIGLEMRPALYSYLLPLIRIVFYTNPRFFPILFFDALQAGPKMIVRSAKEITSRDMQQEAQSVRTKTLLLWGANDTLVPTASATVLQNTLVDSQLIILKRAGHVPMFDQPEAFNAAVLKFLSDDTK